MSSLFCAGREGSTIDEFCELPTLRPDKAARTAAAAPAACLTSASKSVSTVRVKKMFLVIHGIKHKEPDGAAQVDRVLELSRTHNIEVFEAITEHAGHCETLIKNAQLNGIDAVGVMGGDGTLREALQGYLSRADSSRQIPLCVFPVGTGNNFARDLGVQTIEDMFEKIRVGNVLPVDAVKVAHPGGEVYSINCVTWGLARDAAEQAETMRWMGPVRYDVAGFYNIILDKSNQATVGLSAELNGPMIESSDDFLMLFAQSTRCSGRGFTFTPLAQLNDGEFDVVVCKKGGMCHTMGLFDGVKSGGGHVEDQSVAYVKAKRLSLTPMRKDDQVGVDGEVTVSTPVHLTACKGIFRTFV